MQQLTELFKNHYKKTFQNHGASALGADWNDEDELQFRYGKMVSVIQHDMFADNKEVTLLDVGCGWGGLLQYLQKYDYKLKYTGLDIVDEMIDYATKKFPKGEFLNEDIFDHEGSYDYVVCNGIFTQKLDVTIPEMDNYVENTIAKMFELSNKGICFNLMSDKVNYMAENLYYRNPSLLMEYCLKRISPRVMVDHGYSSLKNGKHKFYDFTVYIYKN